MTTVNFDYLAGIDGPPCASGEGHDWADVGIQPDPYRRPVTLDPYVLGPERYVYAIRCGNCHVERYRLLHR